MMIERDENGNLLPVKDEITIDGETYEIYITPLTRGELRKLNKGLIDEFDILKKITKPEYTDEELKLMKPQIQKKLIEKILDLSGVEFKKKTNPKYEPKDDFARNLLKKKLDVNNKRLLMFLHKYGYNFFTINKLTVQEINNLVEAFEQYKKDQERNK